MIRLWYDNDRNPLKKCGGWRMYRLCLVILIIVITLVFTPQWALPSLVVVLRSYSTWKGRENISLKSLFSYCEELPHYLPTSSSCVSIANCCDKMISRIWTFLGLHVRFYVDTQSQMCLFWHFIMDEINEEKLYPPSWLICLLTEHHEILPTLSWEHLFPPSSLFSIFGRNIFKIFEKCPCCHAWYSGGSNQFPKCPPALPASLGRQIVPPPLQLGPRQRYQDWELRAVWYLLSPRYYKPSLTCELADWPPGGRELISGDSVLEIIINCFSN